MMVALSATVIAMRDSQLAKESLGYDRECKMPYYLILSYFTELVNKSIK